MIEFDNVPNWGKLRLEEVLFEFDSIPIVFVCRNSNINRRFLCVCTDSIDELTWILVPVSNETIVKIINKEVPVMEPFKHSLVILVTESDRGYKYISNNYDDMDEDEKPEDGQFLESNNALIEYVHKLQGEKEDIIVNKLRNIVVSTNQIIV